jgi:hypothetical protein
VKKSRSKAAITFNELSPIIKSAVGGAPVSAFSYKLYPEDEVVDFLGPHRKHERHDLPIIYEDDDIVALQ